MRFFELLNFQDVVLYLFPAFVFLFIFGAALAYTHFNNRDSEGRQKKIYAEPGSGDRDVYEGGRLLSVQR